MRDSQIAPRLLAWFDVHGRHDLPWQHPRSAYRVWLAEIMLQQTQVQTVLPYFERFLQHFPDLGSLARASLDEVLAQWAGLGYYSRARNLHRCAQLCMELHEGGLPMDFDALLALPGIGRSTAAAILAQAHGQRHAILDGNVKRVLCRYYAIEGWPGETAVQRQLWQLALTQTPFARLADYTQAIMDLGATVCTRKPDCTHCPLQADCQARLAGIAQRLPAARPRRVRPERRCSLLWLSDGAGRTWLQKRPSSGIWGGLWSLPELDWLDPAQPDAAAQAIQSWLVGKGLQASELRPLTALTHEFTHFRLQLQPWLCVVSQAGAAAAEPTDRGWFDGAEIGRRGLPAPIQRLLGTCE